MYCKKCGQEVKDDAYVCVHCGCLVNEEPEQKRTADYTVSKVGMGVIMALFLGLIGLIIGICIYPENTEARKTFIKGWLTTFLVSIAVAVVFYLILFASLASAY